jgi:glycosyltransferase involved in cell wall biosynthesis
LLELVPDKKVGYVCSQDTNEIAECIKDFYQNNRMETMKENVEEHSKIFSWENMVQSLIKLADG